MEIYNLMNSAKSLHNTVSSIFNTTPRLEGLHQVTDPSSFLTHKVGDSLAHGGPEDEVWQDVGDQCEGHTEDRHHQVTERQRQQEAVGDRAHALVHHQDDDDQQVADDAQEKDEQVEEDAEGVHLWKKKREMVSESESKPNKMGTWRELRCSPGK